MKKLGKWRLLMLLVLVLVLSVVPNIGVYLAHKNHTKQKLFGNEADEMGVLVVWNVDTFEGGAMGKSDILERLCAEFERQNKGVFVLVKNLTVEEFLLNYETEKPNVLSFGMGLFGHVEDCALKLSAPVNAFENVANCSEKGGEYKAFAWCLGAYFVLATEESAARAGLETQNLVAQCMNGGYERTVGKKSRQVFSIEMGSNNYCSAKNALERQVSIDFGAVDDNWQKQSYYDAYAAFVNGNSTFLLGTQRDAVILENKIMQGAVSDLFGESLSSTDLVQFVSAIDVGSLEKQNLSRAFCNFLLLDYAQSRLLGFGMLPVCKVDISMCKSELLRKAYEGLSKMAIDSIC